MSFNDTICKLVIENVELLEEAPNIVNEIQKMIFMDINKRFKSYFDGKDGWKDDGSYNYLEDDNGETSFAPISWPVDEDTAYTAWYGFHCNSGAGYQYLLTALVGKTNLDKFGIFFRIDNGSIGMKKNEWKNFLMSQYQHKPILQESGVTYEGISLCIPISIDPKLMAEEYPDFDTCLKPVDDAIQTLILVNPYIDEIVNKAQKHKNDEC